MAKRKSASSSAALIDSKDLEFIWKVISRNWYLLVAIPLIACVFGYYYILKQPKIYGAKAAVLVKSDEVYNYQERIYKALGYTESYQNIANQQRIIRSSDIVRKAIKKLNERVSYYIVGTVRTEEQYGPVPFKVHPVRVDYHHYEREIVLKVVDMDHFSLKYEWNGETVRKTYRFDQELIENGLDIIVRPTSLLNARSVKTLPEITYMFKLHNPENLIARYQAGLSIVNEDYTEVLNIQAEDVLAMRAVRFLDTLCKVYIDYTMQSQVDINDNTLVYIDRQLDEVRVILGDIEDELEEYKSKKSILDFPREENRYFGELVNVELSKRELILRSKSLDALTDYILAGDEEEHILPPSMYVFADDVYFKTTLNKLYDMQIQRNNMLVSTTGENPEIKNMDRKFNMLKNDMLKYIVNTKDAITAKIKALDAQIAEYEQTIKLLPKTERQLLNIERKQKVYEGLYSYLLEKRANTVIAKAGIVPSTKLIESPHSIGLLKPDKKRLMLSFGGAGLVLALIIAFLRMILFNKIQNLDDLKDVSELPVIGEIVRTKNAEKNHLLVEEAPKATITESFRMVRASLMYFAPPSQSRVILITSRNPGEGKTFCSVNLGAMLAKAGKRTLIVELDMHKPKVGKAFDVANQKTGITGFLIGEIGYDELFQQTHIENLDIALCGVVPPNASELVMSDALKDMILEARRRYDFVIIDTPPIGPIADAIVLMQYADVNLFVLNPKFTTHNVVHLLNELVEKNNLQHVALLLNGTKQRKSGYYYKYYGYGYGYGYG